MSPNPDADRVLGRVDEILREQQPRSRTNMDSDSVDAMSIVGAVTGAYVYTQIGFITSALPRRPVLTLLPR